MFSCIFKAIKAKHKSGAGLHMDINIYNNFSVFARATPCHMRNSRHHTTPSFCLVLIESFSIFFEEDTQKAQCYQARSWNLLQKSFYKPPDGVFGQSPSPSLATGLPIKVLLRNIRILGDYSKSSSCVTPGQPTWEDDLFLEWYYSPWPQFLAIWPLHDLPFVHLRQMISWVVIWPSD